MQARTIPTIRAFYNAEWCWLHTGETCATLIDVNSNYNGFRIPANTTVTVYLSAIAIGHLSESGKPVEPTTEGDSQLTHIGSGSYHFEIK